MSRLVVAVAFLVGCAIALGLALVDRIDQGSDIYAGPTHAPARVVAMDVPTTTTVPPTTTAQPKYTKRQRVALYDAAVGNVNGYPCGGALPSCRVLRCESGGNPTARNPRSSASGLWQILDGTWAGFGGYAQAWQAPPEVQNEKARQLYAGGKGAFHWKACL